LNALLLSLLAAAAPASGGQKPGWTAIFDGPMFPMIAILAIFYIIMIKSKRKQDRARQDLLSQLKRGDRIRTIGGILGTVVEAREDEVVVKVDESSNTKIRFARSAIASVDADKTAAAAGAASAKETATPAK
jgi:preprotein translocase subunit YajC